jgi:hypothetical protein
VDAVDKVGKVFIWTVSSAAALYATTYSHGRQVESIPLQLVSLPRSQETTPQDGKPK